MIERWRGKRGHPFYPETRASYDLRATNSRDIIGISTLKLSYVPVYQNLGYETSLISGMTCLVSEEKKSYPGVGDFKLS